jgi:hypothetical protein
VYGLSDVETQIKILGGTTQKVYRKKSKLSHIKVDVNGRTQTFYPIKTPTERKKLQEKFNSFWKEIGK